MLIISRKVGQRVFIGNNICVEISEDERRKCVRLAIHAPRDVIIDREERVPSDDPRWEILRQFYDKQPEAKGESSG